MSTEGQKEGAAGALAQEGNLLDEILAEAKISPTEDSYGVAKRGVEAFITEMLAPTRKGEKVDKKVYIPFQLVTPENMDQFVKKN